MAAPVAGMPVLLADVRRRLAPVTGAVAVVGRLAATTQDRAVRLPGLPTLGHELPPVRVVMSALIKVKPRFAFKRPAVCALCRRRGEPSAPSGRAMPRIELRRLRTDRSRTARNHRRQPATAQLSIALGSQPASLGTACCLCPPADDAQRVRPRTGASPPEAGPGPRSLQMSDSSCPRRRPSAPARSTDERRSEIAALRQA